MIKFASSSNERQAVLNNISLRKSTILLIDKKPEFEHQNFNTAQTKRRKHTKNIFDSLPPVDILKEIIGQQQLLDKDKKTLYNNNEKLKCYYQ